MKDTNQITEPRSKLFQGKNNLVITIIIPG